MKLCKICICTLTLFISACGQNEKVKDAVRRSLIDPDSAIFGEIIDFKGGEIRRATCVEVNSKNRFGGYAGNRIFIVFYLENGEVGAAIDPLQGNPMSGMIDREIGGSCNKFIDLQKYEKIQ